MAERDLYAELGIKRDASKDEIKKAYRKLARELHPDRNPDNPKAEERFKRVSYAHDVLADAKKRTLYDEFGEAGLREGFNADAARAMKNARAGRGGAGFEEIFGRATGGARGRRPGFGGTLEDLFGGNIEELFGGGFAGRATTAAPNNKVPDQESEITISFEEALKGVEREMTIREGDQERTIRVRIPAGASDGAKVRLRGQGARASFGGAVGDLVLIVRVTPHRLFRREGDDLVIEVPVTLSEAWKGGAVKVPTPNGEVSLKVPPRTQSGSKLRLKGKGMSKRGGGHGDLLVEVVVRLPDGHDHAAITAAFESLDGQYLEDVRAELKS
jgi:curved DNA-binding protein